MDKLEKFYKDFKRPPLAPVYTPTAEEFADPIAYVAKIKPEAEKYGVVKIIPPSNFKPPFVIDGAAFEFTPRVQKLNEIEAVVREKVVFLDKLITYWKLQGVEVRSPVLDNKYVDLSKLYHIVSLIGGADEVTRQKQWQNVAKKMGVRTNQGGSKLKEVYYRLIQKYVKKIQETSLKKEEEDSSEDEGDKDPAGLSNGDSMQSGKRRKGRMMAGLPKPRKEHSKKKTSDPMESVFCIKCSRGDKEELLMLCETCDHSCHTYCCDPPLSAVPKEEWHCADCSASKVFKMGHNFGFYDANTKYNLISFADFANRFKRDYFKKELHEITADEVEKEFWRNVMDWETGVSVKYGADLRVDKVGSGFPRKTDDLRGIDMRLKQHYSNHAWNLNNLPVLKDSVLSHIDSDISGMMIPWVYVGMCFSTFCWHTEDHWTYSINYNHKGESKIWYGVSGDDAAKFEDAVRSVSPGLFATQRDLLHHMTIAVNPQILLSKGVEVWTVHQNAGEFVITFPRAYHAGYNEGFNVAEAVNFAPIDWLKMGRLAVSDYAVVRRTCVFSHEELVIKMVSACEKLSIAMSVAAYEELHQICERECKRRKIIASLGVRETKKEMFESFSDEARECKHCNTTVFLSALSCPHDKIVCLDHAHKLCTKCPYSKCVLRYRYELPELKPLLLKLKERTTSYREWNEQVEYVLDDNKRKPSLYAIENLLETARKSRFPTGNALTKLFHIQKVCHQAIEKANTLLNGKVRTRVQTRIQRADTRLSVPDVEEFVRSLDDLPCDFSDYKDKMVDLLSRLVDWRSKVDEMCNQVEEDDENDPLDDVRELADIGDAFDVKMDELERINQCVRLCEWRRRALRLLRWVPTDEMEKSEDFLYRGRWSTDAVLELLSEGNKVSGTRGHHPHSITSLLHSKMKTGCLHNRECEDWLSDGCEGGENGLLELWEKVRESDWLAEKGIANMRDEIVHVTEMCDRLKLNDVTLRDTDELLKECSRSAVLRCSPSLHSLTDTRDKLISFTKRMAVLIHKPHSYYSLDEMISVREDLTPLAEGQSCPLYLQGNKDPLNEWSLLDSFESCSEVSAHSSQLADKQWELMKVLRLVNGRRPSRDVCICMSEKEKDTLQLQCIMCNGKYHGICVEWDPFLGRLPEGSYLCVRCLRSRRPGIEDVQMASNMAPKNSLESQLIRDAITRSRDGVRSAMDALPDMVLAGETLGEELTERLEKTLINVLSSEIVNYDFLPKLNTMISRLYGDLLEKQKGAWEELRSRPARSNPANPLFYAMGKRKRSFARADRSRPLSNTLSVGRGKRKREKKEGYHDDEESCSAEKCLKPTSEQLNWIQCEAGCSRWYHYICVGLTKVKAAKLGAYACYRCKSSAD